MNVTDFNDCNEAAIYLANELQQKLYLQVEQDGAATLILPGGNSIKIFFPYLAKINIDWSKIIIGLSDERCVPLDHDLSNEKQLKALFLSKLKNYNYLPMGDDLILSIKKHPPITVLSMGIDGHVASLFPDEQLGWSGKPIGFINTRQQITNRLTLTEASLLYSSKIYILVIGKEKASFFNKLDINLFPLGNIYQKSEIIMCLNDC